MKTKPDKPWYKDQNIELVQSFQATGWLKKAREMAELSDEKTKVGAVLIPEQAELDHATLKPFGFGWNYVPSALAHITENRSKYAVHAEMNALEDVALDDEDQKYIMYVWGLAPCGNCLKHLLGVGVNKVVFFVAYDKPNWKNNTMDFIKAMHSK